ncbi:MAG: DUF21 domain-containing protein, partial [Candidatus Methanomethylophilaceae archaeon]
MVETILLVFLLIVLIGLSAFFSISETTFTSVHKVRLKNLINEGSRRAEKALVLAENYDKLLTTILVGNNLANILSSAICTWLFTLYFGAWGVALATVFMLVVILTFGEITPKSIAKRNPEKYAMALASALSFTETILAPVSWIFLKFSNFLGRNTIKEGNETPTLTEKELVVMIDEIEGEGTLEKTESELIKSAIEFDDKPVS